MDAELGPQEASGAVWGDRSDTQPAPEEMSVCLSPAGLRLCLESDLPTALGFGFLLMDRKMRPQKKTNKKKKQPSIYRKNLGEIKRLGGEDR